MIWPWQYKTKLEFANSRIHNLLVEDRAVRQQLSQANEELEGLDDVLRELAELRGGIVPMDRRLRITFDFDQSLLLQVHNNREIVANRMAALIRDKLLYSEAIYHREEHILKWEEQ